MYVLTLSSLSYLSVYTTPPELVRFLAHLYNSGQLNNELTSECVASLLSAARNGVGGDDNTILVRLWYHF